MENKTKKCSICKLDLLENDTNFASRYDRKKKLFQSNCRECQKKYRKKHYLDNKEKYINKAKIYRQNFLYWFVEYKKTLFCEICYENRYWVLDFHHKDPKEKDIEVSVLVRKCNKEKLLNEVKKCMVLCSNCHRDLHYREKEAGIT
jgi:hypothetical protein